MNNNLRIASIPLEIKPGDKAANIEAAVAAIAQLPVGTDIVVLPELFSTGYVDDAEQIERLAELNSGQTVRRMVELARQYNVAIAGTFLARTAHAVYNRGFIVEPSGDETFYDKHHLFCLSGESKTLRAGNERMPVVRFRGWNVAMIVCYDLRFPVWCRNAGERYEVLLVPANWPKSREYAWRHLLIARAIENQAVVVGANCGGEGYEGTTCVFDGMGRPVGQSSGRAIVADVDHDELVKLRERLPVGRDSDQFTV